MEEPGFNAHDNPWQEATTSCILWLQDQWWLLFLPVCVHLSHCGMPQAQTKEQSRPSITVTMLSLPVNRVDDNSSILVWWLPHISSSKPADAVGHSCMARATTPQFVLQSCSSCFSSFVSTHSCFTKNFQEYKSDYHVQQPKNQRSLL
jgi:hypothetical protein